MIKKKNRVSKILINNIIITYIKNKKSIFKKIEYIKIGIKKNLINELKNGFKITNNGILIFLINRIER